MTESTNRTADGVVVGAGIVGASTAYQLAKTGRKVMLVDKGAGPGYGSSSASSGIIRFEYTLLTSVIVAWEAAHCWADLGAYLQAPAGEALASFYRSGKIMMDCPAFPRAALRTYFDQLGIEYEEWDAAELRRRVGGINPGRHFPPKPIDSDAFWDDPSEEIGAVYTPQAGFIDDPRLACENFANAARRAGAETVYLTRVVGISAGRSGAGLWRLTLDSGAVIETPLVVNAAGPWSSELNALAGIGGEFAITTRPLRQEVHGVPAPEGFNPPGGIGPCVADQDLGYYLHPEPSGSLQIGGTEPECDALDWVVGPVDAVDLNRTAELFEKQVTRAARRFPGLAIPPRPTGVAGVYDVATDWTPIYDKTDAPGFYVAIGTSGNQFKNGPLIGEFMNAIIETGQSGTDHDTSPATYTGPVTGRTVDLSFYSRLREPAANSGTVAG
ncbi:MAG: FAD-binding oxidoreductase [Bifidobacteriaceae bacterium]|jgi:glycine/D-amino acid oxidase-like deaminating enzyme|nr:FAD-binding oxidoreductase [Bifidobacteriaceae bacterium]